MIRGHASGLQRIAVSLQVLAYGIASAALLRLIVIGLGTELVGNFQVVNLGFAAFLIFNAWQLVTAGEGPEEDLSDKWIVKACRYFQPHKRMTSVVDAPSLT